MCPIQFFHQGIEYTTRHELAFKYPKIGHNRMQRLLERKDVVFVQYKNTFYFEKASTEQFIESQVPAPAPLTDDEQEVLILARLEKVFTFTNTPNHGLLEYLPTSDLNDLLN